MLIRIIDEEGETLAKANVTKKTLTDIKRMMTVKVTMAQAQEIADLYNVTCINLPPVRKVTDARKAAIASALNDGVIFGELFGLASKSDFLNGVNDRGWRADFDFILKPKNRQKILEGGYENVKKDEPKEKSASFDVAELEAATLARYKK